MYNIILSVDDLNTIVLWICSQSSILHVIFYVIIVNVLLGANKIYYYVLDVDSAIWLVEMCHMMLKY